MAWYDPLSPKVTGWFYWTGCLDCLGCSPSPCFIFFVRVFFTTLFVSIWYSISVIFQPVLGVFCLYYIVCPCLYLVCLLWDFMGFPGSIAFHLPGLLERALLARSWHHLALLLSFYTGEFDQNFHHWVLAFCLGRSVLHHPLCCITPWITDSLDQGNLKTLRERCSRRRDSFRLLGLALKLSGTTYHRSWGPVISCLLTCLKLSFSLLIKAH